MAKDYLEKSVFISSGIRLWRSSLYSDEAIYKASTSSVCCNYLRRAIFKLKEYSKFSLLGKITDMRFEGNSLFIVKDSSFINYVRTRYPLGIDRLKIYLSSSKIAELSKESAGNIHHAIFLAIAAAIIINAFLLFLLKAKTGIFLFILRWFIISLPFLIFALPRDLSKVKANSLFFKALSSGKHVRDLR